MDLVSAVKKSDGETKKALTNVRAVVIEVPIEKRVLKDGDTHAEEFSELLRHDRIIPVPFDLFALAMFPEHNSELNQVIEAMEVNVSGLGWQLVLHPGTVPLQASTPKDQGEDKKVRKPVEDTPLPPDVQAEGDRFTEFLTYGDYDGDEFDTVRRKVRRDVETTGNGFIEFMSSSTQEILGFHHIPSYQMRLTVLDEEFTEYQQPRIVGSGQNRTLVSVTRRKRFRRFVQTYKAGATKKLVWFKELDDPRVISAIDGSVIKGAPAEGEEGAEQVVAQEENAKHPRANPMVHFRIYSARTPYGVPRYIGNLLSILGGRASEEINYTTFKNNNIPSMMIMVSNGQLTDGTIQRLTDFTKSVIQGSDNYSKFIILEADPDAEEGGGQVRIEVKSLTADQHSDAMFQEYEKNNADKVRRAFRLPPIFVGKSDDYTRATAESSRRLGDEQVFAPERKQEDKMWNRLLMKMGMQFHYFRSNGPNVTDDEDIIKVMAAAERSGAMTPRRATMMLEDIMNGKLHPISPSVDLDVPFSQQMAETVKNMAQPNEVGQQVTSLKAIRDEAMNGLAAREYLQKQRRTPAIRLAAHEAVMVATGVQDTIIAKEYAETDSRLFALCDDTHHVATVMLSSPEQLDDGRWRYTVDTVIQSQPLPYVGGFGETFLDGIELL